MNNNSKTKLAILLETFFRQRLASQRRASPATISAYRDSLRLLLLFASTHLRRPPSKLSVEDLDRDLVLAFLDDLEKKRGNSIRTRNARLAAVHSFFQHVAYSDPALMAAAQSVLSIQGKRMTKRVVGYLRQEEMQAILSAPNREKAQGRRDYAILLFLSETGARVSEAVGVNADDLRLERPYQVLLHGKGGKDRVLPLSENTANVLRELLTKRDQPSNTQSPVFINARGHRLTRFGVNHILGRAAKEAHKNHTNLDVESISPHTLRHTAAMSLLQAGVDLTTIQSWLGHVTLDTTHQYVEADVEMKRKALEKCKTPMQPLDLFQPPDELLELLSGL